MTEAVQIGKGDVRVHVVDGEVPDDAVEGIIACAPQVRARTFQRLVEIALRKRGFLVEREVRVPNRGDGRPGRVDLVAHRDGATIALELDRCSPRRKSLAKLACFPDGVAKAVVVHEPFGGWREA